MPDLIGQSHAFILAGGRSRRFGEDKALYRHHGKPFITHAADRMAKHFKHLTIVTKDASRLSDLDYIVLDDLISHRSPLAGIYTGLCHTDTDWNFFLACDMPLITMEIVDKLAEDITRIRENPDVVVPRTPNGLQPLAAFYHKSLSAGFIETASQCHSLKDFIRSCNHRVVDFESTKPFTNVNSKKELTNLD